VLPDKLMAVSLFTAKLLDGLFGDWPSELPSVIPDRQAQTTEEYW
jgi:hypothetical protein